MNNTNNTTTFDSNIYIMPVPLEVADMSVSFYRADAARAKLLGITGYEDGVPLCEVIFQDPEDDDTSWYNGDMPKYLQACLGADDDHSVKAPRYVPASFVRDLILFDGVQLHTVNENVKVAVKLNSYQGSRGDSSARFVLNCNLTAAIKVWMKTTEEWQKKGDKREFAKHARGLAALLDLAGKKEDAAEWRKKATEALTETMPEYCMV